MQSKKIQISGRKNIVKLAVLLGLGAYLSILLEVGSIVSILFAGSLLSVAMNYFFFIGARQRIRVEDIFLMLLTVLSIAMSDWELNFDYYKPAIIVFCTVLCIDLCPEVDVDEESCKMVTCMLLLAAVVTNVQNYYGGLQNSLYFSTQAVALNFSNPNETAMWILFIIVLLSDAAKSHKKSGVKLILLISMLSFIPILYRTQSRNCLFAIVFFFAGKALVKVFGIRKLPEWCMFLITMAPVLVYVGYMYIFIPNYERFSEWFSFLISEGKPLTSRSSIWSELEMGHWKHVLFGNYGVYHTEQLHNAIVTLFCRFGLFYVIIVCKKVYRVLKKMQNVGMQLALSTVWLTGCFETSVFAGAAGMYMMLLLLPVYHQLSHEVRQ